MTIAVSPVLKTVTEFESILTQNPGRLFELIHGEIHEKMPTEVHGVIAANITGELYIYLKKNKIGRLGSEVRHSVDEYNDRIPDISLILNPAEPVVEKGAVPRMPDFAIEIKSPDDTYRLMREKAEYYLANGTQLVWLVYPEKQLVEVYRPDQDIDFYGVEDHLEGGEVLPDFFLSVRDIFTF